MLSMSEAEIETGKAFAIECCERLAGARGWTVTGCAWLPLDDHLEYPLRVTIAGRAQPISIYIARRVIEDSDAQEIEQTVRAAYARAALHPRELDARVEEAVFSRTVRRLRAPDDYDGAQPDTDDQDELHDPPVRRWSSDAEAARFDAASSDVLSGVIANLEGRGIPAGKIVEAMAVE